VPPIVSTLKGRAKRKSAVVCEDDRSRRIGEAAQREREREREREEMIGMVKDMGTRNAGSQDTLRFFNRALEVLASPAPESEQELLDLVKKAKRDADKDHTPAPTAVKKPSRICVVPLCLLVVISIDALSLSLSRSLCGKKIVQYKVLGSDCV
jgi:hypothetical protein